MHITTRQIFNDILQFLLSKKSKEDDKCHT